MGNPTERGAIGGPVVWSYADLADEVRRRTPRLGSVRLVAVDGPGGAGKSTFAERLARSLGNVTVVETDDFASWEKPLDWWADLEVAVLGPLARKEAARYPTYDWLPRRLRGWRDVEPDGIVILEGVSSARLEVAGRLSIAIWVDTHPEMCLARGLARDGEEARPAWERWMAEENAHHAADGTRNRADVIVDGAPTLRHDPETEFVRLR